MTEVDDKVNKRIELFKSLFDACEYNEIDLESKEFEAISKSATNELGVNQRVNNLGDLKVEDLSEYEMRRILKRARSAIKRVVELRKKFAPIMKDEKQEDGTIKRVQVGVAGPYWKSRRDRKPKGVKHSQRAMTASGIIATIKKRKTVPGM